MNDAPASLGQLSVDAFSQALASADPVPGGGSAAALSAALGASLTAMVARLSLGRPRYRVHEALHDAAAEASDAARRRLLGLMEDDARAYAGYRDARRLPHATPAEILARDAASRKAARQATEVPLAVLQACARQIDYVERLVGRSNAAAASDLEVAALLIEAAARGAAANVMANLDGIADEVYAAAATEALDRDLRLVADAAARTRELVGSGQDREPEAA
jgi:formiminotetrahydrofolate cyclodeaminase